MKQLSITLIELPATVDGRLHGRLSDDVYSFVRLPSRAVDLLAAIAKDAGFVDVTAINPSFNRTRGSFTIEQLRRIVTSNVVGISAITRTAPQSYELADYIKKINKAVTIIMGGPHVSALPEEALLHSDIVALNEGDHTFLDILNHLADGKDLSHVKGIAFKDGNGKVIRTKTRPFLTTEELSALPSPIYQKEVLKGITHTVINTSRGCPYACEYCAVIENFGRNFRFINIERTVELIEQTLAQSRKTIFFGDDNFTAIPSRTKRLMEEILRRGIKMPPWLAQVRVESANDIELLKLMKRAGCARVCIGFESINEATLKAFNKHSTLEKNTLAIERFHKAGISIHGMFIVGADTDTKETIRETSEYAKKNKIDTAQFTFIVPLPGTKMTEKLEKSGRVISHEWHLYDGHHVTVKPESMSAHELHDTTIETWFNFYSPREAIKHLFYGNEHWFNFLVRIWGNRLAQKFMKETEYYRKALANLDKWYEQALGEYDTWAKKVEVIANDAKNSMDEKHQQARVALDRVLKALEEKKDELDEYFTPYRKKIIEELEKMMQKRLAELALTSPLVA